jgi:membrane dipeptidase
MIVDAHLDLSYNALRGREVLRPAREQAADDEGIPTVGVPDLLAGGVGLICATLFSAPGLDGKPGYRTPQEAHDDTLAQLNWYREHFRGEQFEPITTREQLAAVNDPLLRYIVLLEGADSIRSPDDVRILFGLGVRAVGLAWKRTRYAGGTGAPGPLTQEGVALVRELDRFGIIHDASHLAEESFWQLTDLAAGPVMASHSNCRAIVPTDRQLSDDMIRAVAARGGVIGINFYDKFLLPPSEYGRRRATLADVVRHVEHVCDLAGGAEYVGLGTDMDGGLGREQIPQEIATSADLPRVGDALSAAGFSDHDVRRVTGENWQHFFHRCLPGGA